MWRWISEHSAGFAWLWFFIQTGVFVAAYDIWAGRTGHVTMTGQVRDWLVDPWAGPIEIAIWVGLLAALSYHFLPFKGLK